MTVTVSPTTFVNVAYDAGTIAALAESIAAEIGLDGNITIEVDETAALGRTDLVSIDPVHIRTESGSFEDQRRLRQFSEDRTRDVLGRYLWRAFDRRSAAFGDPPADDDLSLAHRSAWEVYTVGRMARAGHPIARQRFLYAFRNRHGFTDLADQTFEFLLSADDLTWADIAARSDTASAANPGKLARKPA